MPEREYFIQLDQNLEIEDRVRVRLRTERGQLVDFVAQYESLVADRFYPVVRYDGSHGRGHRDFIDRSGSVIQKDWLPEHLTLGESLNVGLFDITQNWRRYRQAFLMRERLEKDEP